MQNDNCPNCKWFYGMGECAAFPNGIPIPIMLGMEFHDKVVKGQTGKFVFTEASEDDDITDLLQIE